MDQRSRQAFPRRAFRRRQAVRLRTRGMSRRDDVIHAGEEYSSAPAAKGRLTERAARTPSARADNAPEADDALDPRHHDNDQRNLQGRRRRDHELASLELKIAEDLDRQRGQPRTTE